MKPISIETIPADNILQETTPNHAETAAPDHSRTVRTNQPDRETKMDGKHHSCNGGKTGCRHTGICPNPKNGCTGILGEKICQSWNLRKNGSFRLAFENSHRGIITKACFNCLIICDTRSEFYNFIENLKPALIGKSKTPLLDEAYIDGLRTAMTAFMRDGE